MSSLPSNSNSYLSTPQNLNRLKKTKSRLDDELLSLHFEEQQPKRIRQYFLGEILGRGSFSKVREAIDSTSCKRVAIKIIKTKLLQKIKGGEEALKNEISILKKLNHKNVIQLIEVFEVPEKDRKYIVLEFCGAGSLQQVIDSHPNRKLPMNSVWHFFVQMMNGLDYIHNHGVVHRDIKPQNLLVTPDSVLKIADFGVSLKLDEFCGTDHVTSVAGSPSFQCL